MITDKAHIIIPVEYLDFTNIFSKKSAIVLLEYTMINKNAIDLKKGKQPPYRPIYNLRRVELKTLKTYIVTNLANCFVHLSKSLIGTSIWFEKKLDRSF